MGESSTARLGGVGATVAAVLSGAVLVLAFPPYDWWWAAPIGVALLAVAVHRRRARSGAGLGMLSGLCFFVPLLSFTGLQVGWWPWLLLATVQATFIAALGAVTAAASAPGDCRPALWPVVVGVGWVAQEAVRSRAPFGGFPWGRLAFSQADAPTLGLAALGGAPLVTFAVACAGGLFAVTAWQLVVARRRWRYAAITGAGAVTVMALGSLVAPAPVPPDSDVVVAVVQGNVPRIGLDFNAQRRAVLDNHVNATMSLAVDVARGARPRPDVVIWPENSSDIDPLRHPDAAARIDAAARAVGVPIIVGAVLQGPGAGTVRNASLVWTPDNGPGQTYVKRHPVPFAEYVPMRALARRITSLVDRVRADFVAGDRPGVLDVGAVRIGTVICFEVAYDNLVRDNARRGAQVLAVQTNNATFNHAEATQQLAMVRLRAVEHGRPAVMASTVGVSAFVDAQGSVYDATAFNTRAVLVRALTASTAPTLATRAGAAVEGLLIVAALTGAAWLLVSRRNRRRRFDRQRYPGSVREMRSPDDQAGPRAAGTLRRMRYNAVLRRSQAD